MLFSEEATAYEKRSEAKMEKGLRRHGWEIETAWNYSLYHPEDLPFDVRQGELPEPFTTARKRIEARRTPVRKPLDIPQIQKLGVEWIEEGAWRNCGALVEGLERKGVEGEVEWRQPGYEDLEKKQRPFWLTFFGGETAALARLEHFCSTGLSNYKSLRNGSIGWEYSSKMSPWLAAGCISPRQVHFRIREFEERYGESVHTYWVTFELLWRDYMRFFAYKHKEKIFFEYGPAGRLPRGLSWCKGVESEIRLQRWKDGNTGVPWVDGHMRELKNTGFMSNRGRQNVASFLIFNLKVDWRHGAQHFEDTLIDHDVTANWCNWVAAAGVASTSSRVNRFNMHKQAKDYDPDAEHARLWIPELAGIPKQSVHALALRQAHNGSHNVDEPDASSSYSMPLVLMYKSPMTDTSSNGKPHKRNKKKQHRQHQGRQGTYYTY